MWPAAGGLVFGVWARRRRARFLRAVKCGPPQAGSVFTNSFKEMGFIIVLKYPLTSTYSDLSNTAVTNTVSVLVCDTIWY